MTKVGKRKGWLWNMKKDGEWWKRGTVEIIVKPEPQTLTIEEA